MTQGMDLPLRYRTPDAWGPAVLKEPLALLSDYLVRPFMQTFQWCDAMERRWTNLLAGRTARTDDPLQHAGGVVDDLQ